MFNFGFHLVASFGTSLSNDVRHLVHNLMQVPPAYALSAAVAGSLLAYLFTRSSAFLVVATAVGLYAIPMMLPVLFR